MVKKISQKAKQASIILSSLNTDLKNLALSEIAKNLENNKDNIFKANQQDLEKAVAELEKLKQRKITGNTSKQEIEEIQRNMAVLEQKIAEYRAEIPDESLFYDPIPVQYDKESRTKIPKFKAATERLKKRTEQENIVSGFSDIER